jgi:hypothetical protein
MYSLSEDELDTIVIHQKDLILKLIFEEKYDNALATLVVVENFWSQVSYAYKTRELREVIKREKSHTDTPFVIVIIDPINKEASRMLGLFNQDEAETYAKKIKDREYLILPVNKSSIISFFSEDS